MSESEFKLEFVESMRSNSADRRKYFEYLCRKDEGRRFGNGEAGLQLYEFFLALVRKVGSKEAVKEFQKFFLPRLDQQLLRKKALDAPEAASKDEIKETPSPVHPVMAAARTLGTVERAGLERPPKQHKPWWKRVLGAG